MVDVVSSGKSTGQPAVVPVTDTDGRTSNAQAVVIVNAAGEIQSPGGGTQYTEDAAAAANPVGNMMMAVANTTLANEVPDADVVAVRASRKGEVFTKDSDVAALLTTQNGYLDGLEGFVDGIETLIGTTNTNTAGAATSLAIIDDWDESDRCKVNPISGQAGVAAGAGAVGATVQRMTLASDDPLVAKFVGPFPAVATPWTYAAAASGIVNTTTAVTIKAAVASNKNYISGFQIMWEALGTATELAIRDGAGGTVLWRMKIPASLAGAREVVLPVPIASTANTLLEVVTLTASGTGAVYFNAQGFVAT